MLKINIKRVNYYNNKVSYDEINIDDINDSYDFIKNSFGEYFVENNYDMIKNKIENDRNKLFDFEFDNSLIIVSKFS